MSKVKELTDRLCPGIGFAVTSLNGGEFNFPAGKCIS